MLDNFFEFIFSLPLIKKFKPFYEKRRDIVLYIFFGGLTTVVSFFTFWLFADGFSLDVFIANTISWVLAVAFAFFTNRIWVFEAPTTNKKDFLVQLILFYGGRLLSFAFEMAVLFIFIKQLGLNKLIVKLLATIIVLILNYIISKVIVFRKNKA